MTPKRTRSSSSRVRTGCLTCKARRVKCDEAKPSCKKCQASGRQCGGYLSPKDAATRLVPPRFTFYMPGLERPRNVFFPDFDSEQERLAFEHFFHRTSLSFQAEFSTFLMSSVRNQPAIRHAMVALAAVHRGFEFRSVQDANFQSLNRVFAFQRYGRAIQALVYTQNNSSALEDSSYLPVSVLFSTFESLQGNYKAASVHVRSGIKLLQEMLNGRALPKSFQVVLCLLKPVNSLYIPDRDSVRPISGPSPGLSENFNTLEEARKSFHIYLAIPTRYRQIRDMIKREGLMDDMQTKDRVRDQAIQTLIDWEEWAEALGKYETPGGEEFLIISTEAFAIRTWLVITKLYLSIDRCKTPEPTAHYSPNPGTATEGTEASGQDADDRLSAEIYWVYELCYRQPASDWSSPATMPRERKPAFTFQVGAMCGLFMSVLYLEDPSISEHMISHLQQASRGQGDSMWSRDMGASVMRRMSNLRL